MKKIALFFLLVLSAVTLCGCLGGNGSDYTVEAPTFKGFDYVVKRTSEHRTDIVPGDTLRIYCVRSSEGVLIGQMYGKILLRSIYTYDDNSKMTKDNLLDVYTPVNTETYAGWLDSYATFYVPGSDAGKQLVRTEYLVGATLTFKTFGNENSSIVSNQSVNEAPYFGTFKLLELTPASGGKVSTVPNGQFETSVPKTNYDPVLGGDTIVKDADGNIVMETTPVKTVDLTQIYCKSY